MRIDQLRSQVQRAELLRITAQGFPHEEAVAIYQDALQVSAEQGIPYDDALRHAMQIRRIWKDGYERAPGPTFFGILWVNCVAGIVRQTDKFTSLLQEVRKGGKL